MAEKGILHIKLFEYLIEKDGAFGYVQIRDFLLKNFPNHKTEESRIAMKRFLDFLIYEGYIEKMENNQKGIWIFSELGSLVPSDKISSVMRIRPKAVELYNSYLYNRDSLSGLRKTIIISSLAVTASILGLFFPLNKEINNGDNKILIEKIDSILKLNSNLKDENYRIRLKE